ncbi:MAG TPA: 1-deoxy-D-xylulose-5-phosphate reductoisomerase [Bacteroidales bacterium]|nr:1-deoxy-D-xylulose-5-phosphate reductoisomerase [Bacteroidales bacterium]
MTEKKRIALLGSTGSIGKQVLEVAEQLPDLLQVEVLAAYSNASLLIEQAIKFKPNVAVIVKDDLYEQVKEALWNYDIKVFAGVQALNDVVEMDCVDMVVSAIVGIAGLKPIYKAIEARKQIALANKETLVVAGDLMTQTAYENGVNINPIDSEHSAIFQSLAGEFHNPIERIIITASGGPFRGKTADFLQTVTKAQALKHPNWSMGHKITIDSATLMNKGLEVIEAKWLFNTPLDKIEVVIHPQSIVHSLVEFEDGSIKAQLGLPDMKLPIQYALTYPYRCGNTLPRLHFSEHPHLTFEAPDLETFPCLNLAYRASRAGGCMPCVLNAANEMAVALFLQDKIGFYDIPRIIEDALTHADYSNPSSVDDYLAIDQDIKQTVLQSIK